MQRQKQPRDPDRIASSAMSDVPFPAESTAYVESEVRFDGPGDIELFFEASKIKPCDHGGVWGSLSKSEHAIEGHFRRKQMPLPCLVKRRTSSSFSLQQHKTSSVDRSSG